LKQLSAYRRGVCEGIVGMLLLNDEIMPFILKKETFQPKKPAKTRKNHQKTSIFDKKQPNIRCFVVHILQGTTKPGDF
jgi:hypothetical protein